MNNIKSQDVYKDAGQNVIFSVLEFKRENKNSELKQFNEFIERFPSLVNSLRIRSKEDNLKVAIGFSNNSWDYLFEGQPKPKELETFNGLSGVHEMPGSDGDLFFHIRANSQATVYELMSQIMLFLNDAVKTIDETHGFRYFEGRAIIGFIDGTEAPAEDDSVEFAVIGEEDSNFAGGSYAFAQKWIHNMQTWNDKSTEEQEKFVGRKKFSDIELDDDKKDIQTHNSASKIEIDGVEQKIIRMNVPFSNPTLNETGTYFIGYSRHWKVTKKMLEQMIARDDHLLSFSKVISGQLFFIPSQNFIDDLSK